MQKYVVVEGRLDAAVLRTLFEAAELADVTVLVGGGKSPAMSLAASIALSKEQHVAVVVDADTTDERLIAEQRRTFLDLQGSAFRYTKLFLAVPTLEGDLFPSPDKFRDVFKVDMTERQRQKFAVDPMTVIRTYLTEPSSETRVKPRGKMDAEAARNGFGNRLLKDLLAYLREPAETA